MKRLTMLLAAIAVLLSTPVTATATVPTDPRLTAAVAAWKQLPVYVDPQYASLVGEDQVYAMSDRISTAKVPVFVAVLSTGHWFQEKGDAILLAGWLAHANAKPGMYLVMDGDTTYGVAHLVQADGPERLYGRGREESMDAQLTSYLNTVRVGDRFESVAARTEPLPPLVRPTYPRERFTIWKAIANGFGGLLFGLFGGALLAGCVLGLAAVVARRGGGRL